MSPLLHPTENARRFTFSGEDCLYRDHLGRRVVADVEGFGYGFAEVSNCALLAICDDTETPGFHWSYSHYLAVLALGPGDVSIGLATGRAEPLTVPAGVHSADHTGAGWVVGASGGLVVDERHEPAPLPSGRLAIPFFRSARGEGLEIVESCIRCELIDEFSIADEHALKERGFRVQNISKLSLLTSCYPDGAPLSAPVASHLNRASWRIQVPSGCQGLILRKTYDRFHGRQRARVMVDDVVTGWWYEPMQDRDWRWGVSDFGVAAEFVAGRSSVELSIDPPPGAPLWSVSRVEVYACY